MANFTARTSEYYPKSLYSYKTFTTYSWNHFAPETEGNCTWFAFGETSRIVQECKGNESYNIQYTSGNEFMTYGPNALLWISNAFSKGAWQTIGDSRGNYDPRTAAGAGGQIAVQEGDILCYWSSDGFGHVEICERISGSNVYCSGSKARATQPAVFYYTRTVAMSQFKVGQQHTFSGEDANGNIISWSNDYFQGIIRNPYVTGQTPTVTPQVTVSPTSYTKTMNSNEDYLDFDFTITVTGIPQNSDASDGISFSSNCYRYAYTSNWTYSTYTSGGVTYRMGTRSLRVRHDRQSNSAYTTTAYMYYSKTFSNGTASSTTPMYITARKKSSVNPSDLITIAKKKRKRYTIFKI